jgi:heat shock protein HslJ
MKLQFLILPLLVLVSACASSATTAPALANTKWALTSITYNGVTQTPPPGATITLDFSNDDHVSGNSGCNTYSGNLVTQNNILKISGLVSTLRACADQKRTDFEGLYLGKLYEGQLYTITNNQLKITFEGDKGTFLFTAR